MTHQISFGLPDIANVTPKIDTKGLIPVNVLEHVLNDVDDQDEKFVDESWLSFTYLIRARFLKAVLPAHFKLAAKICLLNIQANRMTYQISFGLPDIFVSEPF